jgi:hypothetical protein
MHGKTKLPPQAVPLHHQMASPATYEATRKMLMSSNMSSLGKRGSKACA